MITKGFSLAVALLIAGGVSIQAQKPVQPQAAAEKKVVAEDSEVNYSAIGTGIAKEDNVNVRGQASFTGEVLMKLRKGDSVTILEEITRKTPAKGEPTNWFRISLPPKTPVWVFSEYVDPKTKKVMPNRLNFRGGPGENYSVLGRLAKGDVVKTVSTKNEWMQIETPTSAYAFVAADLIEKQSAAPTPAPAPAPIPEPVVPEIVVVPEPDLPAQPITPEPAPAPPIDEPFPAIVAQPAAPALVSPPPAAEEELARRIVRREGIVRRARNIQAPSYFELESLDSGKIINYLHSPVTVEEIPDSKKTRQVPDIDLEPYIGRRVIVVGEEFMDRRWKRTPVIELHSIDLEL